MLYSVIQIVVYFNTHVNVFILHRMCRALMPGDEESMTDEAIWETLPVCSVKLCFELKNCFDYIFSCNLLSCFLSRYSALGLCEWWQWLGTCFFLLVPDLVYIIKGSPNFITICEKLLLLLGRMKPTINWWWLSNIVPLQFLELWCASISFDIGCNALM